MGWGSPIHWLIVLAIIVLIFGTGKLKNLGSDLGASIKGFKKALRDGEEASGDANADTAASAEKKSLPDDKEKPQS